MPKLCPYFNRTNKRDIYTVLIKRILTIILLVTILYGCGAAGPTANSTNTPNSPPVADAGTDFSVVTGTLAVLTGSGTDIDGGELTYNWTLIAAPPGSTASLNGGNTSTSSLTPDIEGTYTAQLLVSDGEISSESTINITAFDQGSNLNHTSFPSQINLSWADPTNADGTTEYSIYRNNTKIAATKMQSYQDRKLTAETTYSYNIKYINDNAEEVDLAGSNAIASTTKRKIKIQVYETSGININEHSISAFIPLPYGVYTQPQSELANTFTLKNGSGQNIPAQYWVRSRWHARDNSIKEMVVVFKASVNADSITEYYLEEGITSVPTNSITVNEDANSIIVSNNNVSFTINKTQFNFLDSVSYKGKEIINNTSSDGTYLINRFNETYRDADDCTTSGNTQASLTPMVFEVEESGPVRARIRVERPAYVVQDENDPCFTLFGESKDPVPGFVAWFEITYDSNEIAVNYNILNNAITPYRNGQKGDGLTGWPLFYQESGLILHSTLSNPTAIISTGNSSTLAYTGKVIQESDNNLTMNGNPVGTRGGAIKISDSTGYGFALIDPFFHKTYPNGWDFDAANNRIIFLTSPDNCISCEGFEKDTTASNSGLYAINDLSLQEKRFIIKLFDNSNTPNLSSIVAKNYNPPVAVLSIDDYSSIGTSTDMFGISQPFVELSSTLDKDYSDAKYRPNQQTFGIDFSRYRSCTTGGIPTTAMDHMVSRPPRSNQMAVDIYDDIKRPQMLPKYWAGVSSSSQYNALNAGPDISSTSTIVKGHIATEFSSSGYCKDLPIRAFFGNSTSTYVAGKNFPVGYTGSMTAYPRDNQHLWMQQLADAPVDNPMLRYFKQSYEKYLQGYAEQLQARHTLPQDIYESVGDYYVEDHVRAIGNSLISLVDFYLESGTPESLSAIETILDVILFMQNDNGGVNTSISFQDGYMMTGVINAMATVPNTHAIFKKGWSYLYGGGERPGLPGILDAQLTTQFGYYALIGCISDTSNPCTTSDGTATSNIDPTGIAAYLLASQPNPYTGNIKNGLAKTFVKHLTRYMDGEYGNGPYYVGGNWRTDSWQGRLEGRMQNLLGIMDISKVTTWGAIITHKEGLPL